MHHSANAFRANQQVMADCPAILLAGGQGSRLYEMTKSDCKPAIRFGDHARIVDFALGNAHNSGVRHILAATQYRPETLHRRLAGFWNPIFEGQGGAIDVRYGPVVTNSADGYAGTAAAVAANIARIDALSPENVLILAADHVYRMNYGDMLKTHQAIGADLTIAAAAVPRAKASAFGIIAADANGRITDFLEKPADPPAMRDDPARSFASMGIYIFRWKALRAALIRDMNDDRSRHDFGFDLVPGFVAAGGAAVHRLENPVPGSEAYWRDVGTLDAYREAHLDLVRSRREVLRADRSWPVLPAALGGVAALASETLTGELEPRDAAHSFIASHSVIGNAAHLRGSVLMQGSVVGAGSRLRNCIVASGALIDPGTVIGEDPAEDARWFRRTPAGTILVTPAMLSRRRRDRGRNVAGARIAAIEPAGRAIRFRHTR